MTSCYEKEDEEEGDEEKLEKPSESEEKYNAPSAA